MAAQQSLKIVYALDIKFWMRWCTCSMWRMLLASERSKRDTLRSVQLRIADIYILLYIVRANFVLITRKEGGA